MVGYGIDEKQMKEYRYSIKTKIEQIVGSIVLFCILGGILFFIGMFGHLKYVIWIPFLFLIDILAWSVWYICEKGDGSIY